MPTYTHIPDGSSWVAMGADAPAKFAFDARFDTLDGSIWVFQQLGNGWAHYDTSLTLLAQGNFFNNTTAPAVMQHDEGMMLWAQDGVGNYFVRDTTTLYKLNSSMVIQATLALSGFSPTAVDSSIQTFATEDMVLVNSGGTNYVVFCTTAIVSPDTRKSAIMFVVNADTMSVVGTYVNHPVTNNHLAWKVFGDKNGDIWMAAENDDTSGLTLVQWHPANGATGGTLNSVVVTEVSSATLGGTFPFVGMGYDATHHALIVPTSPVRTSNLASISLSTFAQLAYRADDGSVADTNFVDGMRSAQNGPGIKCTYAATGDDPANDFTYNGGTLKLLDPGTLVVTNTIDIAVGINATSPVNPWQTSVQANPAYPGAWVYNAGAGTMLAGYSNLGTSGGVFYVTGLPVYAACGSVSPCALRQIINGGFQDAMGNPLANGYVTFRLQQDAANTCGTVQTVAGRLVKVPLDVNGNVSGTVSLQPTSVMTPAATYDVIAYTSKGQPVWRNQVFQLPAGSTAFSLS